ncbi:hypothetical protein BGZ79_007523 [Entomortierella chlamydospora]|nr:hypothetical protein BGZ79_007523 [Entomortierella chlamydospora]
MDERLSHSNFHATRANSTRTLPLISAAHHRALQLILATEANDVLLTPLQRKNARTLQQHYHMQYIETCLHSSKDKDKRNDNISIKETACASNGGRSVEASGNTSVIDRVRLRVDKTLERKRALRGFVSAISPDKSTMSDYALCLKDLAALSCEPELDLLPVPETIGSLKLRSELYNAQAQAEAETVEVTDIAGASTSAQMDTNNKDISSTVKDSASNSSAQCDSPPFYQSPSTKVQDKSHKTPSRPPPPPSNDNEVSITDENIRRGGRSVSGSNRSQPTAAPSMHPPFVPQQTRQKYVTHEDEEEDDRIDVAPTFDYKPTTYSHNGHDRSNKKRARVEGMEGPEENSRQPAKFITAKEQMVIEEQKQEQKRANHYMNHTGFVPPTNNFYSNTQANNSGYGMANSVSTNGTSNAPSTLKSKLAGTKRLKFKPPINRSNSAENNDDAEKMGATKSANKMDQADERLKNIDQKMIEAIKNEIMESLPVVTWDDISGLEHAKKSLMETITWPMLRPDIFTGLRRPPKGLLLFGPPGTGKTMIGKCIASQSKATFFSISSSSLTSKWVGDGEKMVRALFAVARCHQPAVIFMDEIDSLLSQRSDGEVEASRRIKTEFLVQFDGVGVGGEEDRILIIGATNRPQEIDEAARRRFQKRLYIPLPEIQGRHGLMMKLLEKQSHDLTNEQVLDICERTAGYSGSDMTGLCREAALGPIRAIQGDILEIGVDALRAINHGDFVEALSQVRASVSDKDLEHYRRWDTQFGSMAKG